VTDDKYIDAEQALAVLDRRPVVLRDFQGNDWPLFAGMPAKPVMEIMLLKAQGRSQSDLTMGEMLALMRQMVPEDTFTAWLDGGMTVDEAVVLMHRIVDRYNDVDGESAEGEASGPKPGPTPTSSTGSQ